MACGENWSRGLDRIRFETRFRTQSRHGRTSVTGLYKKNPNFLNRFCEITLTNEIEILMECDLENEKGISGVGIEE